VPALGGKDIKRIVHVPNLKQFLDSAEESLPDPMKINTAEHPRSLATTFRIYFPEPDPGDLWIRNPFSC